MQKQQHEQNTEAIGVNILTDVTSFQILPDGLAPPTSLRDYVTWKTGTVLGTPYGLVLVVIMFT